MTLGARDRERSGEPDLNRRTPVRQDFFDARASFKSCAVDRAWLSPQHYRAAGATGASSFAARGEVFLTETRRGKYFRRTTSLTADTHR